MAALGGVATELLGIFDKLAYSQGAVSALLSGGTSFYERGDSTGDETFELRVDRYDAKFLDDAFAAFHLEQIAAFTPYMTDVNTYCTTDLNLAGLSAYLTARGIRVDQRFAAMYNTKFPQSSLALANIAAAGDAGAACPATPFGTLTQSGSLVAGTNLNAAAVGPAPAVARVITKGITDWVLSVTVKLADASTKVIAATVAGSAPVDTAYVIGAQAVSSAAASGQQVVPVAATGQFKVGQQVLVTMWTGSAPNEAWVSQEVATIGTIATDASLTMAANLLYDYDTSAFVYPLVVGITAASGSGGSGGDEIVFAPAPDRRLAL
jgi:hypothetical protein